MANAHEVDGATVLNLGDQQITLLGVSLDSLHQDDFLNWRCVARGGAFGAPPALLPISHDVPPYRGSCTYVR